MQTISSLDAKDIRILEILQKEGRTALAEIGKIIGLSQPAVSERVKRLEDWGVITGYRANVNLKALGLSMTAIIRLKTEYEQIKPCLKKFAEMPNVIEVSRVTGEDCFVLKVIVPSPEDLETIVDDIAQFGSVMTSIVLRSEPPKIIGKDLIEIMKR